MEETFSEDVTAAQQPAEWNKPCSDEHLADVSIFIADWRAVSPFLDLTEAEEIAILESTHSVPARRMAMLRKWKQKKGRAATYDKLCQAFRRCERLDLIDKMKQILEDGVVDREGPSSNPPHSDSLISYATYLKELYTSMSHSHTSQHWTHLPRCEFIQLAMITDEVIRRGGPEEEMIRLAQQGKIETILRHKESIDLHNLFPFPARPLPLVVLPPPGRVCLIEGAPGVGKSTLAFHICHQWAQGASWLAKFDIVVLAYLRDEAVQNASTLADILPARNSEMSQSVVSQLQATDGKNVLFVFDGWDEFPPSKMNNSFISTIIQQPHKLSLHQATVLITSRPVASANLLHIVDRRVEILGFTQQQIREYIEKALNGNSTHIQTLIQHLEEHPVIEGYCYIPLHSAMLVHLFLTKKGALPTTLHELFCSLVLCCIVREHATHEPDTSLPELSSLDDLPDDLKSKLSNISVLAYNGVLQDKIVFYLKDLQASHLLSGLPSLGLLQAVEGLTLTSKTLSYNFLHLSVQELLAAFRISQMDPNEQVKVFKELFQNHSRFQAVLHYYCGFTKLDNTKIQRFISSCQHDMTTVGELLPLLNCFFETQQPSLCQLIDLKFIYHGYEYICGCDHDIEICELVPGDYLAIGYFIASILSIFNALTEICLSIENIDYHRLKLLLSQLSKYSVVPQACGKFRLNLNRPSITGQETEHILTANNKLSSALSELFLRNSDIEDCLLHIAEALQANSSLIKLRLCDMNLQLTEQNGSALTKMFEVNKSLTHLDLSFNKDFLDSGARCIFKGLQHNTTLVNLDLCNTGIADPDTARCLTRLLQTNKSLTHLNLSYNNFSDSGAHCIFECLQNNTTLVHLNLSSTGITATDPDTARSLTKMLQVNKSLTHLDLSQNKFSTHYIFEGFQHNTTLVNLNLSSTGIMATDPDTARSLTKMLRKNKSLTRLDLSQNNLSDSVVQCISENLKRNAMVELNLSDTGISAKCIFQVLKHNTTLLHLVLRGIV